MRKDMLLITERPIRYDELNHLGMRSAFENEDEPMMFTNLLACGYVGNPADTDGDTWAIDQYDEDGADLYQSFLYVSESEYLEDCKILGLK